MAANTGTIFILGRNWTSPEEHYQHALESLPIIYGVCVFVGLLPTIVLLLALLWACVLSRMHGAEEGVRQDESKQLLKLSEARRAAKHLRSRVTFVLLQIGFFLTVVTLLPTLFYMQGMDAGPIVGHPLLYLGLNALTEPIWLLGIFPTDTRLIRCVSVFQGLFNFFFTFRMPYLLYQFSATNDFMTIPSSLSWIVVSLAEVISNLGCVIIMTPSIACQCLCGRAALSPRETLRRLWLGLRFYVCT